MFHPQCSASCISRAGFSPLTLRHRIGDGGIPGLVRGGLDAYGGRAYGGGLRIDATTDRKGWGQLIESYEKQSHRLEDWARGIGPPALPPESDSK